MAESDFTQRDTSRFQLHSYGWREVDINTDGAIYLLEKSYQASNGIEGIAHVLRQGLLERDLETLNSFQVDQLLAAIERLASGVVDEVSRYATHIEEKIDANKKATRKGTSQ
jgi:hypothetical protein